MSLNDKAKPVTPETNLEAVKTAAVAAQIDAAKMKETTERLKALEADTKKKVKVEKDAKPRRSITSFMKKTEKVSDEFNTLDKATKFKFVTTAAVKAQEASVSAQNQLNDALKGLDEATAKLKEYQELDAADKAEKSKPIVQGKGRASVAGFDRTFLDNAEKNVQDKTDALKTATEKAIKASAAVVEQEKLVRDAQISFYKAKGITWVEAPKSTATAEPATSGQTPAAATTTVTATSASATATTTSTPVAVAATTVTATSAQTPAAVTTPITTVTATSAQTPAAVTTPKTTVTATTVGLFSATKATTSKPLNKAAIIELVKEAQGNYDNWYKTQVKADKNVKVLKDDRITSNLGRFSKWSFRHGDKGQEAARALLSAVERAPTLDIAKRLINEDLKKSNFNRHSFGSFLMDKLAGQYLNVDPAKIMYPSDGKKKDMYDKSKVLAAIAPSEAGNVRRFSRS